MLFATLLAVQLATTLPTTQPATRPTTQPAGPLPGTDWVTMGEDCKVFAAGDINGDGWADLITVNGKHELCCALSIHGWRAAPWRVIATNLPDNVVGLAIDQTAVAVVHDHGIAFFTNHRNGRLWRINVPQEFPQSVVWPSTKPTTQPYYLLGIYGQTWQRVAGTLEHVQTLPRPVAVTPPPHDPEAIRLDTFTSGFSPRGGTLTWTVFRCTVPDVHLVARYAVTQSPDRNDSDFDGLTDDEERKLGTNPLKRDSNDDGQLDGWKVHDTAAGAQPTTRP